MVLLGQRSAHRGLDGEAPAVAALPGGQLPHHGAPAELGAARQPLQPGGGGRPGGFLPLVLVRAGLETADISATVEEFLAAADACGADIEVVDVPDGHHTFETVDPTDASRDAVHRAMRAVLHHLTG